MSNERAARRPVKAVMYRMKIGLAGLLPALLLIASGHAFLLSCDECAASSICDSQAMLDGDSRCPVQPFSGSDPAVTAIHLRAGKHSSKCSSTSCEPICRSFLHEPPAVTDLVSRVKSPDLATSWQFACRAALEPRAPSSFCS